VNPGYRLSVVLTKLSLSDKGVCLEYNVGGVLQPEEVCSCTGTDPLCDRGTGLGTWVCAIPNNYLGASISWDMSTYTAGSGGACGNKATQGPTGDYFTGPTTVALSGGMAVARTGNHRLFSRVSVLLGIGLLTGLTALWTRRNKVR
jgi:hypothetical protein